MRGLQTAALQPHPRGASRANCSSSRAQGTRPKGGKCITGLNGAGSQPPPRTSAMRCWRRRWPVTWAAGGRMSTASMSLCGPPAARDEAISRRMVGLSRFPSDPSCAPPRCTCLITHVPEPVAEEAALVLP